MARCWKWSEIPVTRVLSPELLDNLPAENPGAIRSRRDLVRVNAAMGNQRILARALAGVVAAANGGLRILELGAGDGLGLLGVATRLPCQPGGIRARLVDRQDLVQPGTRRAFDRLGWLVEPEAADVFDWMNNADGQQFDVVLANLFLHHFTGEQLKLLFLATARQGRGFIAVEPRRNMWSLTMSRFIGALGCNHVTRHDAVVSVRAGFSGYELSALWPKIPGWQLAERRAGLFSHLFVASHDPS
jgi:hypothetical protein